ncbi:Bacterial trigger factor protein (TF) [Musa troglodytarum]|uniref:Bacterial trigger factor protein (TF) n=1 Tax=Musa troglodytarum TaxID=320322 RepID=A0A9E7EHW6_9LILI|nr:Bacterial trigger factor protein (TF) [Musa troglodytarum]
MALMMMTAVGPKLPLQRNKSRISRENLKVKSQFKTIQTAEELEAAFTPGSEFGFNAVSRLVFDDLPQQCADECVACSGRVDLFDGVGLDAAMEILDPRKPAKSA